MLAQNMIAQKITLSNCKITVTFMYEILQGVPKKIWFKPINNQFCPSVGTSVTKTP